MGKVQQEGGQKQSGRMMASKGSIVQAPIQTRGPAQLPLPLSFPFCIFSSSSSAPSSAVKTSPRRPVSIQPAQAWKEGELGN